MKVALYARYSSDNQRDASIEDQLRACRGYADTQGWTIVDSYSDRAISGASLIRPSIQELIMDANAGRFQILLTEAMDRLSRDQEDIAGLFKRMSFAGVKIVTLSEGEINHLHIGLTGTMNALYLKELANKTRRGLPAASNRANPVVACAMVTMLSDSATVMARRSVANALSTTIRPRSSVGSFGHMPTANPPKPLPCL